MAKKPIFDVTGKSVEVGQTMTTIDRDGKVWAGNVVVDSDGYLCLHTNYDIRLHQEGVEKYQYRIIE